MGLITAVFIIVVVGMFGVLIARYTTISSVASAEDVIWAQAFYSAESTMRLNILRHDGGGAPPTWPLPVNPTVGGIATDIITDSFTTPVTPATIRVRATRAQVSRTVEAKYLLSI